MYTVIGTTNTRATRVIWMLEELGQPFEFVSAPPHSDAANAHNPSGKVPVLLVDGANLTDSTAILTYLADRHAQFTHPAGTLARARQDGLTQLVLDEFEGLLWTATRHSFILPEVHRLPAIKDSLRWEFARNQTALLTRMRDGPFLMGDEMTVPDFILAHCLIWAVAAKFPVTEPRLQDYLDRMRSRPAYLRAKAR
jgi:glutathione S-transferase